MNAILEQINSMGQTFVEFAGPMLVQSSVLIAILLLVDLALRKRVRAVFRYCIWMLVLAKLVLPSSLSSPLSFGYLFGDSIGNVTVSSTRTTAETVEMSQPLEMLGEGEARSVEAISMAPIVTPTTGGIEPAVEAAGSPVVSMMQVTWQGVVFLVWLAVVGAMVLLLLQRALFVRGLVAQARNANSLINDAFRYCCVQLGMKSEVGLKVSANAMSPAVCGLFRPVILVPQNLGPSLGSSGLRTVLLHELAHIKRRDLWVNLVQTVLQIIYFYNPLLWLANAVIRRVREQAVDETVQVAMGERAQQYPETLVNVAKLAFKRPALSLRLIGVVESKSALKGRIKRMLNRPIPRSAKLGILGLIVVVIIGAVLLPMATSAAGPAGFVIKGTVTDAETGQAIAGVKVGDVDEYANGRQWTITDSNGNYSYLTWYEEHGIKAEAPGYEIQHKGLYTKLFGSEKEKVLDFQLAPASILEQSKFKKTLPNGVTVEDSRNLLMERKDILQKTLQTVEQKYNNGRANSKELQQAKIDLLRVESELSETPQQRIDILDQIVTLYLEQEKTTKLLLDAGRATQDELNKVKLLRLDAEMELARAKAEGNEQKADFKAILPNGVTVELVGVCEYPSEGKQWWRPDGTELEEGIRVKKGDTVSASGKAFAFAVKVEGPEDMTFTWGEIEGARGTADLEVVDSEGQAIGDMEALKAHIDETRTTTSMRIGVASGPWESKVEHDGIGGIMSTGTGEWGIVFSGASATDQGVKINVSDDLLKINHRIIAIDLDGKTHIARSSWGSAGKIRQTAANFEGLSLEEIKEFQFQTRPYEWVEFKNVSLRPGVKTDVEVVGGSTERVNYSSVTVTEGVGFDELIVGDPDCTGESIKSKLGKPDKEVKNEKDWWLNYRQTYGLDFWVRPKDNVLREIRLNKGFEGKLTSGVSMSSAKEDVFNVYGKPIEEKTASDFDKSFENQVLFFRKGTLFGRSKVSKIYYNQYGLLFWFEGDKINQIVIHPKEMETDVGVVERGQHTISTKAEVFGKVTQEGDPSSNARIIARVYSNNPQPGVDSPLISRKTRTDEEGYYHIYNLPAGKLSVAVMSAVGNLNVAQKNLELMPGQKLELDFGDEPGYTVTGTITLDDEPIELAEIFMFPEIPEDYSFRKWGWTNEDGRFRITGLAKGAYRAFIHYDTGLDPETFLWSEGESFGDFRKINIDGDLTLDVSLFSNKAYPNYMTVEDESAEQVALLRLVGLEHRVESAKKLSGLGKALLIYANDHEEEYPDTLQELRPYDLNERDFQNVEYLGKGKTLTISPQAVIAYDKSLFEKGNGTNVLFNDSHVEFANPEQLKKLGIKPGRKPDVEVEVEGNKYNLMARGGKGQVEALNPNAANLIRRYLRALEKSDWKTALSMCSISVMDKAQQYPTPESFFNTVVPVKEILNKLRDPRIGSWQPPPKYFAYIFNVRISQPDLPRDVSWVWKARRLEGRENWEIDFPVIPFETWLANEKRVLIRVAKEKEQLIKEMAPRLKGVRTLLTAKREEFVVGEPIYFRLRLINQGDSILSYDCQQVAVNNSMTIEGPDGKEVKYTYTAGYVQTLGSIVPIKPGESKTLFDQFDITEQYDIRQPGQYRVQFNGSGLSIGVGKEDTSDLNDPTSLEYYPGILPSNVVIITIHSGIKQETLDVGKDGVEGEKAVSQTNTEDNPAGQVEGERH